MLGVALNDADQQLHERRPFGRCEGRKSLITRRAHLRPQGLDHFLPFGRDMEMPDATILPNASLDQALSFEVVDQLHDRGAIQHQRAP